MGDKVNPKEVVVIATNRLHGEPRSTTRPATEEEYKRASSGGGYTTAATVQMYGTEKAKEIFDTKPNA